MCIENTAVSEEHQIQEILTACTGNVSWFDYIFVKIKDIFKKQNQDLQRRLYLKYNSAMEKYYIREINFENG